MKPLFVCILTVLALTACRTNKIRCFEGILSEAMVDTLQLIGEQNRRISFCTEEAEIEFADKLVAGCRVKVRYRGRIRKGCATAVRIEVDPTCSRLLGRWIEDSEENSGMGMGIELDEGNIARSIGMQTLLFTNWELTPDDKLRLEGNSIGLGNTIAFSEDWEIQKLEPTRLTIAQSDLTLRFRRETEEDVRIREEREALALQPAKK